jgi:hypothetical protein
MVSPEAAGRLANKKERVPEGPLSSSDQSRNKVCSDYMLQYGIFFKPFSLIEANCMPQGNLLVRVMK